MSFNLIDDDSVLPPVNVHATVGPDRFIEVRWDGTLRHGTLYSVRRSLASQPEISVLVGLVADTRFKDVSLPGGVTGVTYVIQAHRDEVESEPAPPLIVRLNSTPQRSIAA